MFSIQVYLPAKDVSANWPVARGDTCKEAVHVLFTDDFAASRMLMTLKHPSEQTAQLCAGFQRLQNSE